MFISKHKRANVKNLYCAAFGCRHFPVMQCEFCAFPERDTGGAQNGKRENSLCFLDEQVSAIRNDLSHMKIADNFSLDGVTTAKYFDEISDLVTSLHPRHLSQQAVDGVLKRIQQVNVCPYQNFNIRALISMSSSDLHQALVRTG